MPEVIAIARQGLAIGGPAEVGFDKTTLPYIPGSTLRGALASVWISEHGIPKASHPRREEFIGLFERDIRYGPLFQDGTSVVPLTATWCKYPSTSGCEEWSADAAVDGDAGTCPHCGNGTDTGKGEVSGVRIRRVLRTELDGDGRPVQGRLYARHELESGITYRGYLTGSHPWLQEAREIWLGGRTSTRGLATVEVTPEPDEPAAPVIPALARADGALVVRLTSPAIIVDDAARPGSRSGSGDPAGARPAPAGGGGGAILDPPDPGRRLARGQRPAQAGRTRHGTGVRPGPVFPRAARPVIQPA